MSGLELLLVPLGVGALRLAGSLVTAGRKKLVHRKDKSDKSRRTQQEGSDATSRPLEQHCEEVWAVGSSGTTLRLLDDNSEVFKTLCDTFHARWMKPRPANGVSIVRIFNIQVSLLMRIKHVDYKRRFRNLVERFHGTSCDEGCNFMVDPQGGEGPCGKSSCSVCNICKLGFKLGPNVAGTARATGFPLRYGAGIYLTSVSGKANDYAGRSAKKVGNGVELRCMFVASVALGKTLTTKRTSLPPEACPPPGYQSVVGEVGQGLNYDEDVVYKEEAALPTHLIVYALRH